VICLANEVLRSAQDDTSGESLPMLALSPITCQLIQLIPLKQLLYYLRTYWHEHFKAGYFLTIAVFLALSIWYNYKVDFENTVLDSYLYQWKHLAASAVFYAVPYFFGVFAWAFFYKQYDFLKKPGFWLVTLLGIAVITLNECFYYYDLYLDQVTDPSWFYFVRKLCKQVVSGAIFFLPLIVYWRFRDSREQPLYGFNADRIDLRPYFTMMLIMLPLITWASFQDDFLRSYPTYRPEGDTSPERNLHFGIYEVFYGLSFVGIEFFYRGFLVLAVARYMGAGAIMPMVCMYAYMHFGKPMGETIGSVFGGTILGILAYYSRSIYGGIIIHLGVAYLMELTAFLQGVFRNEV
jgi:hypothetical protein